MLVLKEIISMCPKSSTSFPAKQKCQWCPHQLKNAYQLTLAKKGENVLAMHHKY